MTHIDALVSALSMEDHLGIVYHIETAQQFWSELEDVLKLPTDDPPTLSLLDSTLRRFISLCATYHEQYLQSHLQLEHACSLILDSELFEFHSERMCEIIVDDTCENADPHFQLIVYQILLCHGRRRPDFFRSHKRWQPLIPRLMDHVMVEIDPDVEDTYFGTTGGPNSNVISVPVPIEAKLRSMGVKLLYEVCRVQKLSVQDLRIFDDTFIDYLFDLVEQTRYMHDDTFNYSVIKLIISLNEQFMVASLGSEASQLEAPDVVSGQNEPSAPRNRVLRVLMRRLGSSKTFGENMIFMLNRAKRTQEDLCMQLLILKIIYVLFTTKGTSEYFYTNDLRVLVDVFLRELVDLDEESESLRHTYLRVLHPLLTKTQLRDTPYKRPQIFFTLESLVSNTQVRDVSQTTRRLVDRCLSGDWCVQLKAHKDNILVGGDGPRRGSAASEYSESSSLGPSGHISPSFVAAVQVESSTKTKTLKSSKSVENFSGRSEQNWQTPRSPIERLRRPSNSSSHSLPGVASAVPPVPSLSSAPKRRSTANTTIAESTNSLLTAMNPRPYNSEHELNRHSPHQVLISASTAVSHQPTDMPTQQPASKGRRPAPPAPPKRRKPPAIPVTSGRTNSGAIITTIKSSATSPLAKEAHIRSTA